MTEIRVTGTAERVLAADQAVVRASGRFAGPVREAVVSQAAALQERVLARLRAVVAAGGAERYVADPIRTASASWTAESGERVVEHSAAVSVSITVAVPPSESGITGELVAGLIEDGADPDVTWELGRERRRAVVRELRAEAVADAREAAEDYARELGAAGIDVVSIDDGSGPGLPVMRMALADSAAVPEVTAREIEVGVRIEVRCQTKP